jgi:hypothetical protein
MRGLEQIAKIMQEKENKRITPVCVSAGLFAIGVAPGITGGHKGGVRAMPRKPVNFKLTEVRRAIKAAREAGLPIDSLVVNKDGGFKLVIDNLDDAAKQKWRREDNEVEDWITKQKKPKKG